MNERAVFVDRDGVVLAAAVRDGVPRPEVGEHAPRLLPGAGQAIAALHGAGLHVIIITNQPDIARGLVTKESVDATHAWLQQRIPEIEEIRLCPHDDGDGCACRKPKPGLLLANGQSVVWDLAHSYLVGDRWRDIAAGRAAGCTTVFVDHGYAEPMHESYDHKVSSLLQASAWILSRERSREPDG